MRMISDSRYGSDPVLQENVYESIEEYQHSRGAGGRGDKVTGTMCHHNNTSYCTHHTHTSHTHTHHTHTHHTHTHTSHTHHTHISHTHTSHT